MTVENHAAQNGQDLTDLYDRLSIRELERMANEGRKRALVELVARMTTRADETEETIENRKSRIEALEDELEALKNEVAGLEVKHQDEGATLDRYTQRLISIEERDAREEQVALLAESFERTTQFEFRSKDDGEDELDYEEPSDADLQAIVHEEELDEPAIA